MGGLFVVKGNMYLKKEYALWLFASFYIYAHIYQKKKNVFKEGRLISITNTLYTLPIYFMSGFVIYRVVRICLEKI